MRHSVATYAVVLAACWLLYRSLGLWVHGFFDGWQEVSPWAIVFLSLPAVAAFSALFLGYRFSMLPAGMVGFFASAILFSSVPGILASLVILYSVTRRPLLLTAVWTGLAAAVAIMPMAVYRIGGGGDLSYAGPAALYLAVTSMVGCVLAVVAGVSLAVHFSRKRRRVSG